MIGAHLGLVAEGLDTELLGTVKFPEISAKGNEHVRICKGNGTVYKIS